MLFFHHGVTKGDLYINNAISPRINRLPSFNDDDHDFPLELEFEVLL